MEDGFSSDEEIANVLAAARAALVEREAQVAALAAQLSDKSKAYEVLRARYMEIKQELLLLKKRLFVANAECIDITQWNAAVSPRAQSHIRRLCIDRGTMSGILGLHSSGRLQCLQCVVSTRQARRPRG